ncbi:MAG: hypothetical protein ACR65R_19105, partial [Methylomicrobium sp.]
IVRAFFVFVLSSLFITASQAQPKAIPESRSGHGEAADRYLIKNTEQTANCGGPPSVQTNPKTGVSATYCRVNGQVVEIVKASPKKP